MFYIAATVVIFLIGFFYRKGNLRRRVLRQHARDGFHAIQTAVNYWAEEPDNVERFDLALASMAVYDHWRKRAALFPIEYRHYSAEQFEVADEWQKLFHAHDNPPGVATGLYTLRFRENLVALRALHQQGSISK